MGAYYCELRPAYTGEVNYPVLITLDGSGTISGWTFAGELYDPGGSEVVGAVSVAITDAASRKLTATVAGQATPGEYRWVVRRTDDSSDDVVAHGLIEVSTP